MNSFLLIMLDRSTWSSFISKITFIQSQCPNQNQYRDRAAERRILHGGFGVGPGQKNSAIDHEDLTSSPPSETTVVEALNISFGAGSYAQKILKSMGWKEVCLNSILPSFPNLFESFFVIFLGIFEV